MMTLKYINKRLAEIHKKHGDPELQHKIEAELYFEVLQSIAEGDCEDPKACANEALKSMQIEFARWYA